MRCCVCDCDLNVEGLDNLSPVSGYVVCEICAVEMDDKDWKYFEELAEEENEE